MKMMHSSANAVSRCALLCALAMIFSYIEAIVPIYAFIPLPGFKLGLANIVVLYTMHKRRSAAAVVMAVKVLLSFFMFGGATTFVFSLFGGVLAYGAMWLSVTFFDKYLSDVGHSVIGAFFHNSGQLLAASFIIGSSASLSYYPFLIFSAVISGGLCGMVLNIIEWRLKNEKT